MGRHFRKIEDSTASSIVRNVQDRDPWGLKLSQTNIIEDGKGFGRDVDAPRGNSNQTHSKTTAVLDPFRIESVRRQGLFWEELYFLRKKQCGSQGGKEVFEKFRSYNVAGLPNLYIWPVLWDAFVQLAQEDAGVCDSLSGYVQEMYLHLEQIPPSKDELFCNMVKSILWQGTWTTLALCNKLEFLRPARRDLGQLVVDIAGDARAETFREVCHKIPEFTDMYAYIVPSLSMRYGFNVAYSWHIFLASSGHPSNVPYTDWINEEPSLSLKDVKPLRTPKRDTYKSLSSSDEEEPQSGWSLSSLMGLRLRLNEKGGRTLSDATCARFFATKFFSLETVLNWLQFFNVESIGPISVRTLLGRSCNNGVCDIELAERHLATVKESGMAIDNSAFLQIVQYFIEEGKAEALYDVINCDLHSEIFEDANLMEDVFANYVEAGDPRQIQFMLAVLSINTYTESMDSLIQNLFLRVAIRRGTYAAIHQHIESMIDAHIPVTYRSQAFMVQHLVEIPEWPLVSFSNLLRTIRLWKRLAVNGTVIDPYAWMGLLQLCRKFYTLEMFQVYMDLVTWLCTEYSVREMLMLSTSHRTYARGHAKRIISGPMFWSVLFPAYEMHNFVKWSFSVAALGLPSPERLSDPTLESRVHILSRHPALKGIRFLASLKSLGIHVNEKVAMMSCKYRLKFIYGMYRSRTRLTMLSREFRKLATLEEYILAVEHIWGVNIFKRDVGVTEFAEQLLPTEKRGVGAIESPTMYQISDTNSLATDHGLAEESETTTDAHWGVEDQQDHGANISDAEEVKRTVEEYDFGQGNDEEAWVLQNETFEGPIDDTSPEIGTKPLSEGAQSHEEKNTAK